MHVGDRADGLWTVAPFRDVWSASVLSNLGDGLLLAALPLLAASLTANEVLVAGVTTALTLPWLVVTLPAGSLVDRRDRARLVRDGGLLRAAGAALLAVAVLAGDPPLALLYVIAFLLASAETVVDISAQAVLPDLVATTRLDQANSRMWMAEAGANSFAGPALAGVLFGLAATVPFGLAAGVCLASGLVGQRLVRRRIRSAQDPDLDAEPWYRDIRASWQALRAQPLLLRMAGMVAVFSAVDFAGRAVLVLVVLRRYGADERAYGLILSAGLGATILGAYLAPIVRRRLPLRAALAVVATLFGVGTAVIGLALDPYLGAAGLALQATAGGMWRVISLSLRQELIPREVFGRVQSVYRLLGTGAAPLGALAAGAIASAFGLPAVYLAGLPLVAATIIMALRLPLPVRPAPSPS